jgi:hypothetical protein
MILRHSGHNTRMTAANQGDATRLIGRKTDARRTRSDAPSTGHLPTNAPPDRPCRLAERDRFGRLGVAPEQAGRRAHEHDRGGEGAALLTTDYPPGFLRWMSFGDHLWAATLHGILAASLALLVPGIPPRDRRVLLALASMPIVLSALSDTREQ